MFSEVNSKKALLIAATHYVNQMGEVVPLRPSGVSFRAKNFETAASPAIVAPVPRRLAPSNFGKKVD